MKKKFPKIPRGVLSIVVVFVGVSLVINKNISLIVSQFNKGGVKNVTNHKIVI